jgi:hypothetical protein
MIQKKDWVKLLALLVFMTLMGGYYERLSPDTRTMILPLAIFVVALFFLFQLRKIQFEMRTSSVVAYKIMTNALSFVDSKGNERASVSSDNAIMTFYDENQVSRAILEILEQKPVLKLMGDKGSVKIAINDDGTPSLTLHGEAENIIWSAP